MKDNKKIKLKIMSVFLILVLCLIHVPYSASAAAKKYIVKADVEYTILPGEKISLYVKTKSSIIWTSSNKKVATVSKSGIVTGKIDGSTTITAKVGKKKYKCTVVVYSYEEDLKYLKDIAESDYIDDFSTSGLSPEGEYVVKEDKEDKDEAALKERIKESLSSGSDSKKEYLEFCENWVSLLDLKKEYKVGIDYDWGNKRFRIKIDDNNQILIENVPRECISGQVYTDGVIQYQFINEIKFDGNYYTLQEFYFNKNDLRSKGIIK